MEKTHGQMPSAKNAPTAKVEEDEGGVGSYPEAARDRLNNRLGRPRCRVLSFVCFQWRLPPPSSNAPRVATGGVRRFPCAIDDPGSWGVDPLREGDRQGVEWRQTGGA